MPSPQKDVITLICAHRAPYIYLYSITGHDFYNDLFKHLFHWSVGSSKADSLSGSPPIFISWHRAWHVMDQFSMSCYYLCPPFLLNALWSAFLHICACHDQWPILHFLNPEVTFSVFILIPLSAACDRANHPSFLRHVFTWLLVRHSLSSSLISLATPSQPSLMIPPFSLSFKCLSVPGFPILICTYSVSLTALNITLMVKTLTFTSLAYKSAKAILSNKT